MPMGSPIGPQAGSTLTSLFLDRTNVFPARPAITSGERVLTYAEVDARTRRLAGYLAAKGVSRGDTVAVLSENCIEYLELFLAAGRLGAVIACQNWRLAEPELRHCLDLAAPRLAFVSPRHRERLTALGWSDANTVVFGQEYERLLAAAPQSDAMLAEPEDPLMLLYTSGTTGLPKAAAISHRALVARNLVVRAEYHLEDADTYVAWSPMYHMGGSEYSLGTLMSGGKVVVVDGFDPDRLATIVSDEPLGWLLLMPGMVGRFVETMRARNVVPMGIRVCGVMPDLSPVADIAAATTLLNAPFANSFGATETGNPPTSAGLIPIGVAPTDLRKKQSIYCEVRLIDAEGNDVPNGVPGELLMRGPTLFSGYWRAPEATEEAFRDGWYHMGDAFVRNADGSLSFVDRVKYLIKSGGENIYPAEIERILLQDPRVADAGVVRRTDDKWGEVPVAFVARADDNLSAEDLFALCREKLAGYKQPKDLHFIAFDDFPRSASGKIQRHELEKLLPR